MNFVVLSLIVTINAAGFVAYSTSLPLFCHNSHEIEALTWIPDVAISDSQPNYFFVKEGLASSFKSSTSSVYEGYWRMLVQISGWMTYWHPWVDDKYDKAVSEFHRSYYSYFCYLFLIILHAQLMSAQ